MQQENICYMHCYKLDVTSPGLMNITNEEKFAELEKVLQGKTLQGSENLRAFLRFVTIQAIENQERQLKEYIIATEVFGRGSQYDPRIDSVVRVQAGRLRVKLQEYYATEGKNDNLVIELPKGHYTPIFSHAHNVSPALTAEPDGNGKVSENIETAVPRQLAAPLWDDLLSAPEPVLVVFSNTIFHGTYDGMKLFNSLDFMHGSPESDVLRQSVGSGGQSPEPVIDHYTGIGEVMGVYSLGDFFARMHHPYRLKRSLLLTWDDARTDNIVVLGSPAENLFLLDLPQNQDLVFRWVQDGKERNLNAIVNIKPQPGEQEYYLAKQYDSSPSHVSEDYAVISLLKGLSEKNRLLILAGINTFGTQAAAEYVTQPEYIKDLISHLNIAPPGEPPKLPTYYQILIKVKVNGGVPIQISYVTHHVL